MYTFQFWQRKAIQSIIPARKAVLGFHPRIERDLAVQKLAGKASWGSGLPDEKILLLVCGQHFKISHARFFMEIGLPQLMLNMPLII